MKFYKPKFWDKRGNISLFSVLLLPLSLFVIFKNYHENSKIKKNFYDIKTICVGNIYIGGTGKTPLVKNLANYFKFRETYFKNYDKYPSQISILSYDILGLIYYIKKVYGNNLEKNIFNNKISFVGEVGEFLFEDKIVTHKLDIYQVFNNQFIKISE